MAEFGRWYIAGRDPRYLRRNALVVLGNVGDGSDPATVAALARWMGADDALLAEHARWAARELGRADLVAAVSVSHLLVTNDFPPKLGGIQHYLWELWRRLDPESYVVLTARSHPEADGLRPAQRAEGIRIERVPGPVLAARPRSSSAVSASSPGGRAPAWWSIDPAFPLALVGPHLGLPYAVVLHGAEVAIPAGCHCRRLLARAVGHSALAIAAGGYPAAEVEALGAGPGRAERRPPVVCVPPGVDLDRFRPLRYGGACRPSADRIRPLADGPLVVSVSRLVPRKGMDVLIDASAAPAPALSRALVWPSPGRAGIATGWPAGWPSTTHPCACSAPCPTTSLPQLVGAADVFAMLCRDRWMGLEREGFGIVFLEAAAAGVPQVAGRVGRGQRGRRPRRDRLRGRPADRRGLGHRPHRPAARRSGPGFPHGRGRPRPGRGILRLRPPRP